MEAYRSTRALQLVLGGIEPCICPQARDNPIMSEKFLSRWSKRKLEEREKSAKVPVSPPAEASPDEPDLVTPEEIAVSIVAELIAVRRGKLEDPATAPLSLRWTSPLLRSQA